MCSHPIHCLLTAIIARIEIGKKGRSLTLGILLPALYMALVFFFSLANFCEFVSHSRTLDDFILCIYTLHSTHTHRLSGVPKQSKHYVFCTTAQVQVKMASAYYTVSAAL